MEPRDALGHWEQPDSVLRVEFLVGGTVNEVFRVDATGGSYVLHLLRVGTGPSMVEWEHGLRRTLADQLSFVPAPLPTMRGRTWIELDGRIASLSRYVEGMSPDPDDAGDRAAAARALGRLAAALDRLPAMEARPGWSAMCDLDWRENPLWTWPPGPGVGVSAAEREQVERGLESVSVDVARLEHLDWSRRPVHGDYGPANLLVRGGEVVAVLDFDECRVDWRVFDLADALWGFCRFADNSGLDLDAAQRFIDDYVGAGGPLEAEERAAIPALIRARRLWEALWALGNVQRGDRRDLDYFRASLRALRASEKLGDL